MMSLKKQHISDLGAVTIRPLSWGIMRAAYAKAASAEDSERSAVFADIVLAYMLEDPALEPEDIRHLSDAAIEDLIFVAIDDWGDRDKFEALPQSMSSRERLYRVVADFVAESTQQMLSHFSRLSQQVARQFEGLEEHNRILTRFYEQTTESMQRAIDSRIKELHQLVNNSLARDYEEMEALSQTIGPVLVQAGFWLPPSAPFDLIHSLNLLVEQDKDTPEGIRKTIVDFYETNDFNLLKEMVDDWQQNPYFEDRMHIIIDALEAHIDNKYTLSIPALLPLVEGILKEITDSPEQPDKVLGRLLGDFFREAYKDAVLEYVAERMYCYVDSEYFTPERFPEWLKSRSLRGAKTLQRHAILHGVHIDYASRENSLRVFLLLDVLANINQ